MDWRQTLSGTGWQDLDASSTVPLLTTDEILIYMAIGHYLWLVRNNHIWANPAHVDRLTTIRRMALRAIDTRLNP